MFLRTRKRSSLCGVNWIGNPERQLRQWKKVSMTGICIFGVRVRKKERERKTERGREKINNFEITVIIFKPHKKCKSQKVF